MTDSPRRTQRWSSLRARITLLLVVLLLAVVSAILVATWISTARNVRAQVASELEVSARVFDELMLTRARQLIDSVSVLASDFAFREAVATSDRPTIESALENHGARIDSDRAFLIHPDGDILAGLRDLSTGRFPLPQLLDRAKASDGAAGIAVLGGDAYHLVLAPVKTPLPRAWVGMAFMLDAELARSFADLTGLDVVFLDADRANLAASDESLVDLSLPRADDGGIEFRAGERSYLGLVHRPDSFGQSPRVLLAAPLDRAFAPYRSLGMQLLGLVVVALLLAVAAAWWMARNVSRPLRSLARVAEHIAGGHYEESVPTERRDEVGDLARSFSQMQAGIRRREERIRFQAHHDRLTGLPNRSRARELLAERIDAQATGSIGVIRLDIKEFRQINDVLGHETGDEVLEVVAALLAETADDEATVSRLGGDEFMIVQSGLDATLSKGLADRVVAALAETHLPSSNVTLRIECGLGIAVFPEHGREAETLMRRADIALAEARREMTTCAAYRPGRDEQHLEQLRLAREFADAIREGQMRMLLQPKVRLAGGAVIGAEALVRWDHPEHGLLTPDRFIELAERSGEIRSLTRWVLEQTIDRLCDWQAQGWTRGIAVNLSALDLAGGDLAEWLKSRIEATGIRADRLLLEVTETAVMRDVAQARAMLTDLRAIGIRVAIDDFGTGHSSLAQLQFLPVDQLKIDKSFVLGLDGSEGTNATIVRSIIELGRRMKLEVIAEGVETEAVKEWLRRAGCDLGQGFGIARPMPEDEFPAWVERYAANEALNATESRGQTP